MWLLVTLNVQAAIICHFQSQYFWPHDAFTLRDFSACLDRSLETCSVLDGKLRLSASTSRRCTCVRTHSGQQQPPCNSGEKETTTVNSKHPRATDLCFPRSPICRRPYVFISPPKVGEKRRRKDARILCRDRRSIESGPVGIKIPISRHLTGRARPGHLLLRQ